jgi:hypothetical protein
MKNMYLLFWLLITTFGARCVFAQEDNDLSKYYGTISKFDSILNNTQKDMNSIVFYRFGWNQKAPYKIAVQFVNLGYGDHKLKFAVKDVTSKKMIVLDPVHNSRFGTEMLKSSSKGVIWSGPIDNINDLFSLRVWVDDGEEMDKNPMSIKDKK